MFGSKKDYNYDPHGLTDDRTRRAAPDAFEQEWEEVYRHPAEAPDAYEPVEEIDAAEDEGIFLDEQAIPLDQFPALRMAYEIFEPHDQPHSAQPDADLPEYVAESDGEDGLTQLIMRHAQLAEQEEAQAQEELLTQPAEYIPELFRAGAERPDTPETQPGDQQPDEEFTMESELLKQRQISGELFDYIDVINSDALDLIRQREQSKASQCSRPYDPYNMQFNNRYDNRESVLENTPEIELAPRFELKQTEEN